jgi:hypothetical protein
VREYLIAYAPEEKPLWVVAVMHGRRNPRMIAAILSAQGVAIISAGNGGNIMTVVTSTVEVLVLDLLEWLARRDRS